MHARAVSGLVPIGSRAFQRGDAWRRRIPADIPGFRKSWWHPETGRKVNAKAGMRRPHLPAREKGTLIAGGPRFG